MHKKQTTFAERFDKLVREFGSRYRLSKASHVPESTLQQYSQSRNDLPPRADILLSLARAANVSLEWLATGRGEMRPAGLLPGPAFADVVMVEVRDPRAALQMQRILGFLPFSGDWLERRLGLTDHHQLIVIEADQGLPPVIKESDLLLIDRTVAEQRPTDDGIYVLSVARGLTIRHVHVRFDQKFLVSGPSMSEEVAASEIARLVVGKVVWRGGRL